MTILIIIFGVLMLIAGLVILVNPETLFGLLRDNSEKPALQILAIVTRAVLGLLLIYQASESRFPVIIEIVGWLSLAAAIFLAVIGRRNFIRLMSWALSFVKPFGRAGGILAATFGAFIIFAFV